MRTRAVSLILLGALVVLAACTTERSFPPDAPAPKPERSEGFFVQLPAEAAAAAVDAYPGVVLTVTSNLPDGTLAYVTNDVPGMGEEVFLLHRFVRGVFTFRRFPICDEEGVGGLENFDVTRGFNVQLLVVPDVSLIFKGEKAACESLSRCGTGPFQPSTVQSVLGRNLERLTGDQVTSILGTRALVASAHYAWPTGGCRKPLDVADGFPNICPPSSATINEEERGENLDGVVRSIPALLGHNRGCDTYNFTTTRLRNALEWPSFRDRLKQWLKTKGHTPAISMNGHIVSQGPGRVGLAKSPTFLEVEYFLHNRRVVRARFTATATRLGYTRWEIAKLELL